MIANTLWNRSRSRFAYTKTLKTALLDLCDRTVHELELNDDPNKIAIRFMEFGFLEGYYEEKEKIQEAQKGKN